jgi:hypothetical protein
MNGPELQTFCKEINGGASIGGTLLFQFIKVAKAIEDSSDITNDQAIVAPGPSRAGAIRSLASRRTASTRGASTAMIGFCGLC